MVATESCSPHPRASFTWSPCVLTSVDEVRRQWPSTGFVIGGQALSFESQARAQVRVCARVSEVLEAVDAMVKGADMN